MHAEYIDSSIDCAIMVIKENEELLLNLHKQASQTSVEDTFEGNFSIHMHRGLSFFQSDNGISP